MPEIPPIDYERDASRLKPADQRVWDDLRGREWTLCDRCDMALVRSEAFTATVLESVADDSGAAYCRECARSLVAEWQERGL